MTGLTDLDELIRSMRPVARDGQYVVLSLPEVPADLPVEATIREDEGVTVVVERSAAEHAGLDGSEYVAAWITLQVHSSLAAVGLTAAFSAALGAEGISCNVLAGFHHDHLLVPDVDRERALEALRRLAAHGSAART